MIWEGGRKDESMTETDNRVLLDRLYERVWI